MTSHITVKACSKSDDFGTSKQHAHDNYLKAQDVEAQPVAAELGLFDMKRAFDYLIYALEWHLDPKDDKDGRREAQAPELFTPEFHIPAVTCWVKHTGRKLYEGLCNGKMNNRHPGDILSTLKHFDHPAEWWPFWKERSIEVSKDWPDEFVRNAAEQAMKHMQDIA